MARDDYHVIVYKILTYLYHQLKKGDPVDRSEISYDSKKININREYWKYILENMQGEKLIRGFSKSDETEGNDYIEEQLEQIQITPKGIDLLNDDSMLKKVDGLIKGIVKKIPGV